MKAQLKIKIIKDINDFHGLSDEWNELLDDCETKNVFLTWEWLYTLWKVYGLNNDKTKLYIIEVRDENERIVGLAPMKIRKAVFSNCLEFIGNGADVVSEYLKIIIRKGWDYFVIDCVKRLLSDGNKFDVVSLKPLQVQKIDDWYSISWGLKKIKKFSSCPVVDLPKTWTEFLERQSKNFVKKTKEYYRVCQRDLKLKFIRIYSEQDLSIYFDQLERLHHLR